MLSHTLITVYQSDLCGCHVRSQLFAMSIVRILVGMVVLCIATFFDTPMLAAVAVCWILLATIAILASRFGSPNLLLFVILAGLVVVGGEVVLFGLATFLHPFSLTTKSGNISVLFVIFTTSLFLGIWFLCVAINCRTYLKMMVSYLRRNSNLSLIPSATGALEFQADLSNVYWVPTNYSQVTRITDSSQDLRTYNDSLIVPELSV